MIGRGGESVSGLGMIGDVVTREGVTGEGVVLWPFSLGDLGKHVSSGSVLHVCFFGSLYNHPKQGGTFEALGSDLSKTSDPL